MAYTETARAYVYRMHPGRVAKDKKISVEIDDGLWVVFERPERNGAMPKFYELSGAKSVYSAKEVSEIWGEYEFRYVNLQKCGNKKYPEIMEFIEIPDSNDQDWVLMILRGTEKSRTLKEQFAESIEDGECMEDDGLLEYDPAYDKESDLSGKSIKIIPGETMLQLFLRLTDKGRKKENIIGAISILNAQTMVLDDMDEDEAQGIIDEIVEFADYFAERFGDDDKLHARMHRNWFGGEPRILRLAMQIGENTLVYNCEQIYTSFPPIMRGNVDRLWSFLRREKEVALSFFLDGSDQVIPWTLNFENRERTEPVVRAFIIKLFEIGGGLVMLAFRKQKCYYYGFQMEDGDITTVSKEVMKEYAYSNLKDGEELPDEVVFEDVPVIFERPAIGVVGGNRLGNIVPFPTGR